MRNRVNGYMKVLEDFATELKANISIIDRAISQASDVIAESVMDDIDDM